MKKFQFSLETLLFLRREKEKECEITLALAAGNLKKIEKKIDLSRLLEAEAFNQTMRTMDDFLARDRIWMKSVNDRKALNASKNEAFMRYDEAKGQYMEAHIQRNTLDRLKKKRFERWRVAFRREEINRLDEVAKGVMRKKNRRGEKV